MESTSRCVVFDDEGQNTGARMHNFLGTNQSLDTSFHLMMNGCNVQRIDSYFITSQVARLKRSNTVTNTFCISQGMANIYGNNFLKQLLIFHSSSPHDARLACVTAWTHLISHDISADVIRVANEATSEWIFDHVAARNL